MQRGLKVFPLKPGGKTPLLSDWQNGTFADANEARSILSVAGEANVGCFLERGFVLDFDKKGGKDGLKYWDELQSRGAPATYVQRTPSGGLHVFYLCDAPVRNSASKIAPGVDVRGTGGTGYVVGAGSALPQGEYTVETDAPIADAPAWLVDLVGRPAPASLADPRSSLVEPDADASIERAKAWLINEAPEAIEGAGGDHTTFAVAAMVRDFGVSEETCFELMAEHWNDARAFPPWNLSELEVKIANAYRHAQKPAGTRSPVLAEEEFKDETAGALAESAARRKFQFAKDVEKDFKAAPQYLIEGMYDRNSMVVTYGESNSGKTHVVLDQAFAIASGRPWAGKRTHQGLVYFVAAEGGEGIQRRVMAHKVKYGAAAVGACLAISPDQIDLRSSARDAKDLLKSINEAEALADRKCVMVVIDTLSRALAGGDENGSVDMGALVKQCDAIKNATGATVHLVHHSGKDKAKGARGHSLLRAATDTEIEIAGMTISATKQRDMEVCRPIAFGYHEVLLGEDSDGKPVRSVVLQTGAGVEFDQGQSVAAAAVVAAIRSLARKGGGGGAVRRRDIVAESSSLRGLPQDKALQNAVDYGLAELSGCGLVKKTKRAEYLIDASLKA
jgi:hypothetical protein